VAWPNSVIHQIRGDGQTLAVFFRDDVLSNRIAFKQTDVKGYIEQLRLFGRRSADIYVVTAMDAETFGHHIRHWEDNFLAEMGAGNDSAKNYADLARGPLDRAMQSDQFWWASRRPMWDINLVNRGLMQ
jgi:hypothetical protein